MRKRYLVPACLLVLSSCSLIDVKGLLKGLGVVSEESALSAVSDGSTTQTTSANTLTTNNPTTSSGKTTTTQTTNPTTTTTTSNTSTTSQEESYWDLVDHGTTKLPIGNDYLTPPDNIYSPTKLVSNYENTSWVERDMQYDLPSNWSHIYGNNKTNGKFYSETAGGGLKLDQPYKGFQSEAFNCSAGKRIELRLTISSVNNASGEGKIDDWGFIYFYDKYTNLLTDKTITLTNGDVRTTSAGNYKRWYINDAENVSYFEFRLAALCHYNAQNYNIGIKTAQIKLWPDNSK